MHLQTNILGLVSVSGKRKTENKKRELYNCLDIMFEVLTYQTQ